MTTPSETARALFGRVLPLAPAACAGRRPCVACGLVYLRTLDAAHHLCPHCAADLVATRAHVASMEAAVARQRDAATMAEVARVDALPDEVAERYGAMVAAHAAALGAFERTQRQPWPASMPVATRAAAVQRARARLEAVTAKIARTEARVPDLAPHIAAWRAYHVELRRLADAQARWAAAREHCDLAAGEIEY